MNDRNATSIYAGTGAIGAQAAVFGSGGSQATEAERPIARGMSELAAAQGDLDTAARGLVARIARLIPGGSPFDSVDRMKTMQNTAPNPTAGTPVAVASDFCGEINARIWGLREITARLNEAAKSIEL